MSTSPTPVDVRTCTTQSDLHATLKGLASEKDRVVVLTSLSCVARSKLEACLTDWYHAQGEMSSELGYGRNIKDVPADVIKRLVLDLQFDSDVIFGCPAEERPFYGVLVYDQDEEADEEQDVVFKDIRNAPILHKKCESFGTAVMPTLIKLVENGSADHVVLVDTSIEHAISVARRMSILRARSRTDRPLRMTYVIYVDTETIARELEIHANYIQCSELHAEMLMKA